MNYFSKKYKCNKEKIVITLAPKKDIPNSVGCIAESVMLDREYSSYRPCIGDTVRKCYSRYGFIDDLIKL